jgi:hypothetical protein
MNVSFNLLIRSIHDRSGIPKGGYRNEGNFHRIHYAYTVMIYIPEI